MKFKLSGNLLRFSDFRNDVTVEAETVSQGVKALCEQCPHLKQVLLDGDGKVRALHRLFLNGEQLMANEMDKATKRDDEVSILTAIAGG